MDSPYSAIQDRLNAIAPIGRIQPGLERIQSALNAFEHPEKSYPGILVAGTKGKGSTAVFIAAGLSALGYSVGLFTSPHLVDLGERILVNGEKVPVEFLEEELATYEKMWASGKLPRMSFFEILTLMSARYFQGKKVDFAVWEVGLGGRLDSTNALPRWVNVLTPVSKDHTDILGKTLRQILAEKMAIHRSGTPFLSSRQRKSLLPILQAYVDSTDLHLYGRDFHSDTPSHTKEGQMFHYHGISSFPVTIRMHGEFQRENASTALRVLEVLLGEVPPPALKGIQNAFWPGRLEVLSGSPTIVLDGAHNPHSALALVRSLKPLFPNSCYHFIVGIQATKDYRGILKILERLAYEFLFVEVPGAIHPLSPQVLSECTRLPHCNISLQDALQFPVARHKSPVPGSRSIVHSPEPRAPHHVWVITGSLYLVGAARHLLNLPWVQPYGKS